MTPTEAVVQSRSNAIASHKGTIWELTGTIWVWHASGDSRVATLSLTSEGFGLRVMNWPKYRTKLLVDREAIDKEWLLQPRMDVKWINPGSVWVPRVLDRLGRLPLKGRRTVDRVTEDGRVHFDSGFSKTCFELMSQCVRLWDEKMPKEPKPYQTKVSERKPRAKKSQRTVLDRLLEEDPFE